eukprot:superscaffoldBa00000602_g5992
MPSVPQEKKAGAHLQLLLSGPETDTAACTVNRRLRQQMSSSRASSKASTSSSNKDCSLYHWERTESRDFQASEQIITGGDDEPYAIKTDLGFSIVLSSPWVIKSTKVKGLLEESRGGEGLCSRLEKEREGLEKKLKDASSEIYQLKSLIHQQEKKEKVSPEPAPLCSLLEEELRQTRSRLAQIQDDAERQQGRQQREIASLRADKHQLEEKVLEQSRLNKERSVLAAHRRLHQGRVSVVLSPLIVLFGWHAWTRLHLCVLLPLLCWSRVAQRDGRSEGFREETGGRRAG